MFDVRKNKKGITLIALVITIIILLILAGITINALTGQNGLFVRADDARIAARAGAVEEARNVWFSELAIDEAVDSATAESLSEILSRLEEEGLLTSDEVATILGNANKEIIIKNSTKTWEISFKYGGTGESNEDTTIAEQLEDGKIAIGDYVNYTPTGATFNWLTEENGISYGEYAGNGETGTITEDSALRWRILDANGENGEVRLISDQTAYPVVDMCGCVGPAGEENAYNNAVYLLDKICSTIYNGDKGTAKSLKIEDITDHITGFNEDPETWIRDWGSAVYGTTISTTNRYYPNILVDEENQTVVGGIASTQGTTIKPSEQINLTKQISQYQASNWTLINTYMYCSVAFESFEPVNGNPILYYNMLFGGGPYYDFWLASRAIGSHEGAASFCVRYISGGMFACAELANSDGWCGLGYGLGIRPVVTLNSDVKVTTGNGITGWTII